MEREAENPGPGNGECAWPEEEQGNPSTVRFARLFACRADLPFFLHAPPENLKAFFWEKTWPGLFPGGFFTRRAPAASESVAS